MDEFKPSPIVESQHHHSSTIETKRARLRYPTMGKEENQNHYIQNHYNQNHYNQNNYNQNGEAWHPLEEKENNFNYSPDDHYKVKICIIYTFFS